MSVFADEEIWVLMFNVGPETFGNLSAAGISVA